jgi:hypothetical protein
MTSSQRSDADSPWKLVLRTYFREAIDFYFPAIAAHIDWSIAPEFLDKEFSNSSIGSWSYRNLKKASFGKT